MVKCSIKFCTRNARADLGISFFRWPAESARCDEWMRALGRPDLQGINADKMHQSKYRVCGVHFDSNSFSSMLMNRLKKEAVPILFPSAAGVGPFFVGTEVVEGDKYITFVEKGTEFFQNNGILEPENTSNPKEITDDSQTNSENNDSNDVPSEDLTNDHENMDEEESAKDVNSNKEKLIDDSSENSDKPIENGLSNDSENTHNMEKETEEDKSAGQSNSQNEEAEDDDDDFNPLLLCPDISMDVEESPVLTSGEAEPTQACSTELLDSNALFAPLFSTFVDEMTGAEISFNLTSEEQQLREKLYGPNNPIEYSKIHCTACNVHLGSALAGQTNRFVHPLLKVLICKECYHFYTSGEFEKDEDGSELYCRWCGQGGQVLCCTMCEFVFCKKCIRINFGRKKLTEVRDSDDWKCFRCDPSQLKALRAMCVEFFEYIRKATSIAATSTDPDHINKDLTNCCQTQQKRKIIELESEKEKDGLSRRTKKRKNEEDPDYNPFARQDSPEPPSTPVASTSGTPITVRPMPPLIPKPTMNEVSFPGHSPSPTVRIGNTVLSVKSAPPAIAAAAIQARNAQNFASRTPNTAIRSSTTMNIRPKPTYAIRTPNQPLSPRTVATNQLSALQANHNSSRNAPALPSMKHEWFEKTVRAAARVNSNLSYTLTQLNKAQANASSVEQLAVVHNKLQEVLSSSINSLIQIRKNLRTEFIAGIKTIRFPPKPPVDPNDDDVIIVNSPPSSTKIKNENLVAGLPQISVKKNLTTSTPTKVTVNENKESTGTSASTSSTTSTSNRVYLKVKSFSQLQTVTSECITIPDDDPPTKDDEPVIVGNNIMPQVEKDPLAGDPSDDNEDTEANKQSDRDKNTVEEKSNNCGSSEIESDKNENVVEVEEVANLSENEQGCDKNDENSEVIKEINEEPSTSNAVVGKSNNASEENTPKENNGCQEESTQLPNGNSEESSNTCSDKEINETSNQNEGEGETNQLSNGTSEEVSVKKEPEEVEYNVKDKPSPKIRRMLSVKVNLKKTTVVEDMVKQEPAENGGQSECD